MPPAVVWQFGLLGLVLVVCAGLFVLGLASPPKSIVAERRIDWSLRRLQERSLRLPGQLAQVAVKWLGKSRKAAGQSASAGRETRRRAT